MRLLLLLLFTLPFCFSHCHQRDTAVATAVRQEDNTVFQSYSEVIAAITIRRDTLRKTYRDAADKNKVMTDARDFWVQSLATDLYEQWQYTPWDFDGTTRIPREGAIACGYFVTTLLLDMGCEFNRVKLSTCASLTMMKQLTPDQSIHNWSYLPYDTFNKKIKEAGKNIFIIGLDYHTGFLVNDGEETWFLHSNYIRKQGVVKEKISESAALRASVSRYVTCLTSDTHFLVRWLNE